MRTGNTGPKTGRNRSILYGKLGALGVNGGLVIVLAACVMAGILLLSSPKVAYCSEPGLTSTASAEISVTVAPRIENLKFVDTPEGAAIRLHVNFDGRIERLARHFKAPANPTRKLPVQIGQQQVLVQDGDLIIIRPL
ncbi:MAG: hypothetical protein EBZ48_01430 [Proteobacteria bacterium]|nr:hypothetical protein [Pseudomonadota bacterium]